MPCFGIGMINDYFHIAGIRQVVAERLKRAVMYSMALGPRCFKWKMLSFILCLAFCSAINSFNSSPQLGHVCLLVHGFNQVSPFCRLCTQMRFWMVLFNLGSSGEVGSLLWSVHHVQYLCWYSFLMESVASSRDVV